MNPGSVPLQNYCSSNILRNFQRQKYKIKSQDFSLKGVKLVFKCFAGFLSNHRAVLKQQAN